MCSELFRIPYHWGGVPIFGLGLLLAVWAVASALTIASLVRQHGWSGETISSLPVLLLAGAAIVFLPRVFPDGLPIRGYGVMLLLGISAGVAMAMYRARQGGLDPDVILSLAIWLVICGVIGARLFYVIEYWEEKFAGKPPGQTIRDILNIPEGGLVIYGGFVGAVVGFTAFVRRHKLPLLAMADLVAPSFMIGLALGRVGCLLNGCCYGGETDWPWAVTFPQYSSRHETTEAREERRFSPPYADQAARGEMHGFRLEASEAGDIVVARVDRDSPAAAAGLHVEDAVVAIGDKPIGSLNDAKNLLFNDFAAGKALRLKLQSGKTIRVAAAAMPARSRPVHPTQLYSAIDAGLLGWLLWAYYPMRRRDGVLVALMLTIHPVTRFLLEIIRTDEQPVFNTTMSISQNVSILLLAAGAVLWWYLLRGPREVVWPLVGEATSPKVGRNDAWVRAM